MPRIEKPWGYEELIEVNESYVVKRLMMRKGHKCSLQYHRHKKETVYVLQGALKLRWGTEAAKLQEQVLLPHEAMTLKPGVIHRMEAVEDAVYLESSTPQLDDVVRLQDEYGRTE